MAIITAGVRSPNNTIGVRQNLKTLLQPANTELLHLYLQGLRRFQDIPQTQPDSWFQISGIHGRPYIPYDGVGSGGSFGGYCTHSSILFPTWHRPYLALYEQELVKHMTTVANQYRDQATRNRLVALAQGFRIPYWDWAEDADPPDIVSIQQTVTVNGPEGPRTINNPLFSYRFNPIYSDFGDGLPDERTWEAWQTTQRYPTRRDASSRSNSAALEAALRNNSLTLRDRTYNLLTQAKSYEAFSNDGFLGPRSSPLSYDSLESIHGQIHGLVGQSGHMGVVDYAGFDPIFWLHHTNVDRLFALWQAINPTQFVTSRANNAGTFTTRRGTVENATSPLTPFYRAEGRFWTSNDCRDTRTLFYTYPELQRWSTLTPQEKSVRIHTEVNRLYGRTAPVAALRPSISSASVAPKTAGVSTAAARSAPEPAAAKAAPVAAANVAPAQPVAAQRVVQAPAAAPPPAAKAESAEDAERKAAVEKLTAGLKKLGTGLSQAAKAKEASRPKEDFEVTSSFQGTGDWHTTESKDDDKPHYHEWIANIRVEKYAVKKTCFIHIFLGDFTPDSSKWGEDKNLVGTHVIFANNLTFTGCEKCHSAAEENAIVTGTIPLTGALGDKLGQDKIGKLEPQLVIPYLQRHLHWRIQDSDGKVYERTEVKGLKISVGHVIVELPNDATEFPKWGEAQRDSAVTAGRPGGAGDDDDDD